VGTFYSMAPAFPHDSELTAPAATGANFAQLLETFFLLVVAHFGVQMAI